MPRQSSRRPAASHSSSRPSLFGGSSQSRSASTMSAPSAYRSPTTSSPVHTPAHPATPSAAPQQPGMFAQMATTAAGVAVGSAVGHTLGAGLTGMFSGSSNDAPAQQEQQQLSAAPAQSYGQQQSQVCDADARNFTKCLEDSDGNYQACDFYLQQLKACQSAARQY